MRLSLLHVGFLTWWAFLASACGAGPQVEPLPDAVRSYNDAIRWQRYTMAAERLPAAQRDRFLDMRDRLQEDLRINDYEVIRVRYDDSLTRARVHIKLTWHLDSRGIVHDTHAVQTWKREGKVWILVHESYLRGEPMPGLDSTGEKGKASGTAGDDQMPDGQAPDDAPDNLPDSPLDQTDYMPPDGQE